MEILHFLLEENTSLGHGGRKLESQRQRLTKYYTAVWVLLLMNQRIPNEGLCYFHSRIQKTGVPFGDNIIVRDFLKINGKVDSPSVTHPKRQIYGLNCPRREISGQRLWGWAEKQFHSAENFLNRFWIHNYCPLLFMEASSKNRTPDKLPANERESLETCCNKALIATINLLQPRLVVGVGKYATKRIRASGAKDIVVGEVMHPSPANPKANKEWRNIFETQLKSLGIVV